MNNMDFKSSFSLLHADYVQLNKAWNYRNVMSPFYRIYLIDGGEGSLGDSDQSLILEKGYLYLIPSFTLCDHACSHFLSQYYVHILEENPGGISLFSAHQRVLKLVAKDEDVMNLKRLLVLNPGRDLRRSDDPKDYQKQPLLLDFQQRNNQMPLADYVETQGIILQLLARFLTDDLLQAQHRIPAKIAKSVTYIQTHLTDPITVESLAEQANQSPHYFSKGFLAATGQRPLTYLQHKRIERAQFLMLTTSLPLSDIASQSGFESLSYFSRVFRKLTGQTPSQYQQGTTWV